MSYDRQICEDRGLRQPSLVLGQDQCARVMPKAQVEVEIGNLREQCLRLNKVVANLISRLAPVMSSAQEDMKEPCPEKPYSGSIMARAVNSNMQDICSACDKLDQAIAKLEI